MRRTVVIIVTLVVGALIVGGSALAARTSASKTITVPMTGAQETAPKGSPTGKGTARIMLDSTKGQICYTLSWSKIKPPVAAHIHKGAKGTSGPIVVPFFTKAPAKHTGCVKASRQQITAIIKKPTGYYVNVHTTDYPAGAIRGQL
jgi:hypothetical protein